MFLALTSVLINLVSMVLAYWMYQAMTMIKSKILPFTKSRINFKADIAGNRP